MTALMRAVVLNHRLAHELRTRGVWPRHCGRAALTRRTTLRRAWSESVSTCEAGSGNHPEPRSQHLPAAGRGLR
jgi:hypothetical protein